MESIRQPFGSQEPPSRFLYFDAHTLSPSEGPGSEGVTAGVPSSTSGSTTSSPDRESVNPPQTAEECHASTSGHQSPSHLNYVTTQGQSPGNTNLARRKKTSNACHFCRREWFQTKPIQKKALNNESKITLFIFIFLSKGRKLKCDAGRPCGNCAKRSQSCEYDERIKRRGPGKRTKDPATAPPPRLTRRRANTSRSASGGLTIAGEELTTTMLPPLTTMTPGIGSRPGTYVPPDHHPSPLDPVGPTTIPSMTRNASMHRLDRESSMLDFEPPSIGTDRDRDRDSGLEHESDRDSISNPNPNAVPPLGLIMPDLPHPHHTSLGLGPTGDPPPPSGPQYHYGHTSQTRQSRTSSMSTGPISPQSYSSESMASQSQQSVYTHSSPSQHHHRHSIPQQYYPPPPSHHGSYGTNFSSSESSSQPGSSAAASRAYQYVES